MMKTMLRLTLLALCPFVVTPCSAGLILLSETRSVTASYYGSGIETISSAGTFGSFEATAVGTPLGGGYVSAYQNSNFSSSGFTVEHRTSDFFGAGGSARSSFEVTFSLLEPTRITISGYCNFFSGFASLTSVSSGAIPLVWHGPNGSLPDPYKNYLEFDRLLAPGQYTLSSYEIQREVVVSRLALHGSSVPDGGSSALMLAIGVIALGAMRWRFAGASAAVHLD